MSNNASHHEIPIFSYKVRTNKEGLINWTVTSVVLIHCDKDMRMQYVDMMVVNDDVLNPAGLI